MRLPRERDDWIKNMVTFLLSQSKTNDIFKHEQPPKRRCFGFDYHKYPEILVNLMIMQVLESFCRHQVLTDSICF